MPELFRSDSEHHKISVDETDGVVSLRFNGRRQSSLVLEDGLSAVQPIIEYFHIALALVPNATRVLCIGLGGGVLPKRLWHDYPDMHIDVVELDSMVVDVAYTYFGLPKDDRLGVIVAEGREFLARTAECYDLILVDAYFEAAVPFALVTREFIELATARLAPGGALAYNIVGVPDGPGSRPFQRFVKTMAEVLAATYVFPVGTQFAARRQNILVVGSADQVPADEVRERIRQRVGGRVCIEGFEEFAAHLRDKPIARGLRPYRDAEMPADGLLHA